MKGFFKWFSNSTKMKRWIFLILIGIVLACYGMSSILTAERLDFWPLAKIIACFVVGFVFVILGMIHMQKRTLELLVQETDNRVENEDTKVNTLIYNKRIYDQGPKIVAIGGGTGLNSVLKGLKNYTDNLTAIVTVSDYGEIIPESRRELGTMPLDDIKESLVALAKDEETMEKIMNMQFSKGKLRSLSFGDIYLLGMKELYGDFAKSVEQTRNVLNITGRVLPVTLEPIQICAELEDGTVIESRDKIPEIVNSKTSKINRIFINPTNCKVAPGVVEAIEEADAIVIGPGSLYTNVIPNLLVNGVAKAIKESKAIKIYINNIMTEFGQTDNYSVADHIKAIIEHCGEGLIDYCIYDTGEVIPEYIKKYNLDGAELVEQNLSDIKDKRIKFIKEDMSVIKDDFVRHNSMLIADTLIKIICDDMKFKDRQNEPEYLMMNSKLQVDKEIKKEMKRQSKNKKSKNNDKKTKSKSKFASKYSDRIESIKHADEKAEKRKRARMIKKQTEPKKIEDQEKIRQMLKQKEEILKAYRASKEKKEVARPKDYDEIRREKIEKFNNRK